MDCEVNDFMSSRSIKAILDAFDRDTYSGKVDVDVFTGGESYTYHNITLRVYYDAGYRQITVSVMWEEDSYQPDYKSLGLHGMYNTNFQDFKYSRGCLQWEDGPSSISIRI